MMTRWTDKNETSYSFEHVLKIWRYVESKNEKKSTYRMVPSDVNTGL